MSGMRILMLGNSYIFTNDMPEMLSELIGAEVVQHTRGGARLSEQLNPKTEMGVKTLKAFAEERWDYVVLQEMNKAPVTTKEKFLETAALLCDKIHSIGAVPVFYLTWAYQMDEAIAELIIGPESTQSVPILQDYLRDMGYEKPAEKVTHSACPLRQKM